MRRALGLVIRDELRDLPFSQAGRALLFHLLSGLCEHTRVVYIINLVCAEWVKPALMPRSPLRRWTD